MKSPLVRPRLLGLLLAATVFAAASAPSGAAAAQSTREPRAPMSRVRDLRTIPFWEGSFTFREASYPYEMVGRDPARNARSSTIGVDVYAVRFTFADGQVLDGRDRLREVLESPIFHRAPYATGNTQLGSAIQRATFWSQVSNTDWGVLLDPEAHRTLKLSVPADKGRAFRLPGISQLVATVDIDWFDSQLQLALAPHSELDTDPQRLAMFVGLDTALLNPDGSVFGGYHNVVLETGRREDPTAQTYLYASWVDAQLAPAIRAQFGVTSMDISTLSHEVLEWLNDPFLSNVVPPWPFPGPSGGCATVLETGDPLEFRADALFAVTLHGFTYHPQNEALLPWFARQAPSLAFDGAYSFPNASLLTSPAPVC